MYPTISDLLYDWFGVMIPLPIQSFGFMMAVAFIFAAIILYLELKRKHQEGLIPATTRKVLVGTPAKPTEMILSGLFWFVVGFKLVGGIVDYDLFSDNPQDYVLSMQGHLFGGLIVGGVAAYMRYREKEKARLKVPEWKEETVLPQDITGNIVLIAAGFGILGAKLFHNLENLDELMRDPVDALLSFSGLTFYGGLIFAAIAVLYYGKKKNVDWRHMIDAAAPALILAYGIGRIGCQLAGDGDWGIVNVAAKPDWLAFLPDWMWSFNYPHNVLNEGIPIPGCEGKHCMMLAQPVYPTPVYETFMCLLIFAGLWFSRKRIKTPGLMFSIYLVFNGIERFFIEQIRVNTTYNISGRLITQAEIISVALFLLGCIGIWYFTKKK
ncbi:MAG: prolipoprotein diacylglyceryl transferase family protein, partial [Bacteroidota bacterium]